MGKYGQGWVDYWNNLKEVESTYGVKRVDGALDMLSGIVGRDFKKFKDGLTTAWAASAKVFNARYIRFFKALFNHPGWYKYHGQIHLPTINGSTPFDVKSLRKLLRSFTQGGVTKKVAPGIASGHVIHCNFTVEDFTGEDAWELAIMEAFRLNRMLLKSNLVYNEEDFAAYIYLSILVMLKAKQIERTIGWYNVVRGDIPELQGAISHVTVNYSEVGNVRSIPIQMLSDDNIAKTLTAYEKLISIVNMLQIPVKLAEFISFYAGSVFTDQSAPNPNLYIPMIRDIPLYDENGQVGIWNIETSDINDVIKEALAIVNRFGVESADIARIGAFGTCHLVPHGAYTPVVLDDPGFFTILINSYECSKDQYDLFCTGNVTNFGLSDKSDFLRCDILPDVNGEHTIVLANALGAYAGVKTLLRLRSQAIYINVDESYLIPRYCTRMNTKIAAASFGNFLNDVESNSGEFIQFSTLINHEDKVEVKASSSTVVVRVNENLRMPSLLSTQSLTSLDIVVKSPLPWPANQYVTYSHDVIIGGYMYDLFRISADVRYSYFLATEKTWRLTGTFTYVNLVIYDSNTDTYSISSTLALNGKINPALHEVQLEVDSFATPITTTTAGVLSFFQGAYASGVAIDVPMFVLDFTITNTTNPTATITSYNTGLLSWFIDNVDYHMPIVFHERKQLFLDSASTSHYIYMDAPVSLLKELYIPVLINEIDIQNTLYWMYLGLFSVYDSAAEKSNGLRDTRKHKKSRSKKKDKDNSSVDETPESK